MSASRWIFPPVEPVRAFMGEGGRSSIYPSHRHDTAELVLYHEADGHIVTTAGRLAFGPGSVAYCPPGIDHAVHLTDHVHDACSVVHFCWLAEPPQWLEAPWTTRPNSDRWLAGEFAWLASRPWPDNDGLRLEAACRLAALLAHVRNGAPLMVPEQALVISDMVRAIQDVIRRDLRAVSVSGLARKHGLSPDHLSRLFRVQLGYTVRDAIALARVEEAKVQLSATDDPLVKICERIGYSTAQRFCAMFRRVTGMTPGAFRRLARHSATL
jgi:AraC-like DNA-binding protein